MIINDSKLQVDGSAGLNPLFEEIFVVRVSPGSQSDGRLLPLTRIGIDKDGHQSLSFRKLVDQL